MPCPHETPLEGSATITTDTASLAVEFRGDGPAVVLLHAGVADLRSWRETARLVQGRTLVAYDRRGFGRSTWVEAEHDHVADLCAVLDHFAIEDAVLVGNSQGGRVAIDAMLEPGVGHRVRSCLLIGTAIRSAPSPDEAWLTPHELDLDERIDVAHEVHGDIDTANELEAQMWLDGPLQDPGRVTGCPRQLFLDMNGIALRADLERPAGPELDRPSAWDQLDQIRTDVQVAIGSLDLRMINERARIVAERIPGATLTEMDGVAHLPMLEAPDRVAALISAR